MKNENHKKIKVIYISGIGRSGSTLLDLIISANPPVFSVGEIIHYNYWIKERGLCKCGKKLQNCKFWKNILVRKNFKIINHMNIKDYIRMMDYLFNPLAEKINFHKNSENFELFEEIIKNSSKKNLIYILDSSKDIARLIELDLDNRLEVYNISIVRNGMAVANSFSKPLNGKGKNYFISLLKWIFLNTCMFKYLRIRKNMHCKNLVIGYEHLCTNPEATIKRIENFLGISIEKNYPKLIRKMECHNIGGNRIALKENRSKFRSIIMDNEWKTKQNIITKLLASSIVYPLNKKWVYPNATKEA